MPEPPPRKRFQIHVSTAIVLMFVAGALIWANVTLFRGSRGVLGEWYETPREHVSTYYGWPLKYREIMSSDVWGPDKLRFDLLALLVNIGVASGILILTCSLSEWLIRRRAARKEP